MDGDVRDERMNLLKNNTAILPQGQLYWETTYPYTVAPKIYGGPTDLWRISWTPSDVNSSNFGIEIASRVDSFHVTSVTISRIAISVYFSQK